MIVYGKQIFLYLLKKHPNLIEEFYFTKELDKKLFAKVKSLGCQIKRVDSKKAQAMARGGNHQGFLLKVKDFQFSSIKDIKNSEFILVLSGITDVGNIGAIIRSAYALGVSSVIIGGISSINLGAVARTSVGAVFDMPILVQKDILSLLNEFKQVGFTIYCADMDGEDIRDIEISSKRVLVLGSEGEGLSGKVLKNCQKKVMIKMQREFDSLNVSAASAILCDRMRDARKRD